MNRHVRVLGLASLLFSFSACSGGPTQHEPSSRSDAIIGGVDDTTHPAVVLLTNPSGNCTASLIAPNLVLTARHCVAQNVTQGIGCDLNGASTNGDHVGNNYSASSLKVFTGQTPQFWGTPVAVGAQLFTTPGKNLCNNDIALLVLNKAVTSATPLKIRRDYPPLIGELVTAVGYGAVNDNSQGSGKRRMRANVAVRSVGKDYNEGNGDGELSTSQGICSGDSGGPIFSAGGAVLGIASRSAQCTNPADSPKYVRLDYHKALIDQAFAAAGAAPSLEAGTGTPIVPKAVGESPCKTGAECISYLCSPGGYCTNFCSSGSCPTGLLCQDTTFPNFKTPVKTCAPLGGGTACEQCRNTECVNVVTDCYADASCKALLACADACADAACIESCKTANANGVGYYDSVTYCACNSTCATPCSTQCVAGTGGTGGSAGAPAGGGGSTSTGAQGGGPAGGTGGAASTGGTGGATGGTGGFIKATSDSGSSGGCSVPRPGSSPHAWLALGLLALGVTRRRPRALKSSRQRP